MVPPLPPLPVKLPELLAQLETGLIDQALAQTNGNRAQAAKLLGVQRTTLVEKLKRRRQKRMADEAPAETADHLPPAPQS